MTYPLQLFRFLTVGGISLGKYFVEALEECPTFFIQSKTSVSARKHYEGNRWSKYVMLLSNLSVEHSGLGPVSAARFRHQLVPFPRTVVRLC